MLPIIIGRATLLRSPCGTAIGRPPALEADRATEKSSAGASFASFSRPVQIIAIKSAGSSETRNSALATSARKSAVAGEVLGLLAFPIPRIAGEMRIAVDSPKSAF